VCGAPSVERELALSHTAYVAFVFAAPLVLAAALEAGIALKSDAWDRRKLVLGGQLALAASLLLAASTTNPWLLALALAIAGAASGVACGAAQAILVLADERGADRAMIRWAVFAAIGDVLAPILTASAIALGVSYRGALIAVAVLVLSQCLAFPPPAHSEPSSSGAPPKTTPDFSPPSASLPEVRTPTSTPTFTLVRRALQNRSLWLWLFAAASCTLLDELVVALASLRLSHDHASSDAGAAASGLVFAAGSLAGAALTDRAVSRVGSNRVLASSALITIAALAMLVFATHTPTTCAALFFVGVACAPHHALAFARAYDALPESPGTVQACAQLLVAVDVVAPLALGAIADRFGLHTALACLALQPVVILVGVLADNFRTSHRSEKKIADS
jgi:sugar phosphate permease